MQIVCLGRHFQNKGCLKGQCVQPEIKWLMVITRLIKFFQKYEIMSVIGIWKKSKQECR